MTSRARCSAVLVAALFVSCNPGTEQFTYRAQGRLCAHTTATAAGMPPTDVTFEADRPVRFSITMARCLSPSCTKNDRAACEAKLTTAAGIDVGSNGFFERESKGCTGECKPLVATCDTPPLAAGIYTVVHGPDRLTITVPSTVPLPCVGFVPSGDPIGGE